MAFHIEKSETDALARKVAALKTIGVTEAVHAALAHELVREQVSCLWSNSASSFAGICAPGAIRTGRSPPT
ncbi:hypothetical protein ACVWZV_009041 [Bradyrhizobium sp. GM5.1]|uniref:type II toxin-antitoxin system VapB family antitoxin n=1 Tax=unclassified Bradyrhizobium TaxID=2631580 RepID=UPI001FF861BC|nr:MULTISPECIES: type II toxin-antitoxin system VapB family antitoxin [unclassified Bradyrhizobium]